MILSFCMSLFQIELTRGDIGTPFIGFRNYIEVLSSSYFWDSIGRTVYFTVVSIGLEMLFGFLIALLFKPGIQR